MSVAQRTNPGGPPRPQTCGRCRLAFPGDATLVQDHDNGWFACPSCTDLLLGAGKGGLR